MVADTFLEPFCFLFRDSTSDRDCCNTTWLCTNNVASCALTLCNCLFQENLRHLSRLTTSCRSNNDAVHVLVYKIENLSFVLVHGQISLLCSNLSKLRLLLKLVKLSFELGRARRNLIWHQGISKDTFVFIGRSLLSNHFCHFVR